ncbi:hypothetical protein B0H14DRAFT_2565005 [Mycena olivaceomarginata]|nr:hypothetical protein B0H14DRAFT_2565005 [Mycena olivaceomarginata]
MHTHVALATVGAHLLDVGPPLNAQTRHHPRVTRSRGRLSGPAPSSLPLSESDDDSTDEYGLCKAEQRRREDRRVAQGGVPAPQSDEDEDMQDLLEEIRETGYHDHSDDETVRKNTRLPKAKNGKERGVKPAVRHEGEVQNKQLFDANADANAHDDDNSIKHKSGPLSLDIQDRAIAAHEDFLNAIEGLANEAGKSAYTLHQFLGTSVKLL